MTSVFRTPELSACKNHSRLHRFFIRLQTKHKVTHVDSGLISDSGKYLTSLRQRQMKTVCFVLLFVSLVFGDTGEEKSVMEGENITLPSDVKQPNETVLWYFEDTRIALINGEPSTSCLYYGKGEIFRDRLDVDYKTGSLIITDIRSEHAGRYETEIIRGNSTGKSVPLNRKSNCDSTNINNKSSNNSNTIKTFNVHVNGSGLSPAVPGSGLSPAVVAVIVVVGVLLVAAAVVVVGVIYYRRRSSRNAGRRNNEEVLQEDEERCSLGSPEISS